MRFAAPQFLWALLLVGPLLLVFYVWAWRVKQKTMAQFIPARLLSALMDGFSPVRQKIRFGLVIGSVAFLIIALARPQWGYAWEEAKQQGLDIVIALDTSRSMLATDVAPNRLSRAKLAVLDLMKQAKNDRLGLVCFAGTSFLQTPLTLDEEAFRQNLDTVTVGIIPEGGTDLGGAINTALTAFEKGNDNHKVLILFTDGEDHESDDATLAAAEAAAKAGMKIFTIGVGSPEGQILQTKDENGNDVYIKDEDGNAIRSRLNQTLLQKVASAAEGFYLPLQGANPMETLYERGLKPLPKSEAATKMTRVYYERFYWPLAIAILCLIAEMLIPDRKRTRRPSPRTTAKAAAIVLGFLLLPHSGISSPATALREYNSGKFEAALNEYERLAQQKTNDYRLRYNAGTAAYQAKKFEAAKKQLEAAIASPEITSDLPSQQQAYYNLANTDYLFGEGMEDIDQKKQLWSQSITNYTRALQLNTNDLSARNNLEFVKRKLAQLNQQQQQQNKDQKDNKDKKDQNQKDQQNQQNGNDQKKDQKDQKDQKSDNQQKKDSQPQDGSKKDQNQDQKKAQDDQEKKEQEKQAASQSQKDNSQEKPEQQQPASATPMTQADANRMLDAQQEDVKPFPYQIEREAQKVEPRKRKDW